MGLVRQNQRDAVVRGELDVGRLFVDTRQVYLDAKATAAELDEPAIVTEVMWAMLELLGHILVDIRVLRSQITEGELGLRGFDADLVGLQQRFRNLYRPFFQDLKPIDTWTEEDWRDYEEFVEGPVLLWDLKTCQERWGVPFGSPPCEGPDLQMALSLLHQTGVAGEFEQELLSSYYGFADLTLRDIASHWEGQTKAAFEAAASAMGDIADTITDYAVQKSGAKSFALGAGTAIAGLGLAGLYLFAIRKKPSTQGK
ncbi:MAG: hypothetical protein AAF799_45885 [Myxococcota bacterium]